MDKKIHKVLVTGGAGYIGNIVVRRLLAKGYKVKVIDYLVFGESPILDIKDKIEFIKGDIRKMKSSVLDDIDAVIHLAGFSTEPTSQYDPRLTDLINHIATETLAKMARSKGIKRFIYASSCSVYFSLNTPLVPPLYNEEDTINPISCYSLTKRCAEQVLWGMTNEDFQPTIFRKGTLYGLSPRMRYDLVFNSFVKDAFLKKVLTVDAAGEIWRPMIDIVDTDDAYIKCLELPLESVGGKIFNVTSQNWRIGDLAEEIAKVLKKKKGINLKLDIKPYGLTRNYKADNKSFKKVFNFKPSRSFEQVLMEIWENLENNPQDDPTNPIHYGDVWYKMFFETKEGKKFKKHI